MLFLELWKITLNYIILLAQCSPFWLNHLWTPFCQSYLSYKYYLTDPKDKVAVSHSLCKYGNVLQLKMLDNDIKFICMYIMYSPLLWKIWPYLNLAACEICLYINKRSVFYFPINCTQLSISSYPRSPSVLIFHLDKYGQS